MFTPVIERELSGGIQKVYKFDNNYGASVVRHNYSYGVERGLWELAVIKWGDGEVWDLCYDTPITDDIIGYLDDAEVDALLSEIKSL